MTEKIIKKILDDLTHGVADHYIVKRPLTETVYVAKVWPHLAFPTSENLGPLNFYFICLKDAGYRVAVQVEENTLSIFASNTDKKAVDLPRALREIILPHILQQKPLQRTSINKLGISAKELKEQLSLLSGAGFRVVREDDTAIRLAIQQCDRIDKPYIHGQNTGIPATILTGHKTKLDLFNEDLTILKQAAILQEGDLSLAEDINDLIELCVILGGKLAQLQQANDCSF